MVDPSTDFLYSISAEQIKHLVVELDIQDFIVLLVENGILVTSLEVVIAFDDL